MKPIWILMIAIPALAAGYFVRLAVEPLGEGKPQMTAASTEGAEWTCSMHPQVRLTKPGLCPLCNMDLIPAVGNALVPVEVQPVERRTLAADLRAVGKVEVDETTTATVTARVDGYVEHVIANTTGLKIERGDPLLQIYSPELYVAQHEFLLSLEHPEDPALKEAARLKLARWDFTEGQIADLEKTRLVEERPALLSPVRGTILEKHVVEKSPVMTGDVLYRVADLSLLWVQFDLYEYEIGGVQTGQPVTLTTEAFPGETFKGKVAFISPTLNEETRSIRVRVEVTNLDGRLRPGMFVGARIERALGEALSVPVSAVLDSGVRRIVYVERAAGEFEAVEVTLGPRVGDHYVVEKGLEEGDRIVVRGNFLLDSQFQIEKRVSLMNATGDAPAPEHHH